MTALTHTQKRSLLCLGGAHGVCNVSDDLIEHCFCHCHTVYEHRPKSQGLITHLAVEFWRASDALPHITDQQIGDTLRAVNLHYYQEDNLTQGVVDAFVTTIRAVIVPDAPWSLFTFQEVFQENLPANFLEG